MQKAARVGDATNHGGTISSGSGDVYINGIPAAMVNKSVASCAQGHGTTPVVRGSGTVFINNLPAARVDDVTGCGAAIKAGSNDVSIG